jgi:hypothetical protein
MVIDTLIKDIYSTIKRKDGWFNDEISKEFSYEVSQRLQGQFQGRAKTSSLRLSQLGPKCPRALWYATNAPETAEHLPAWAEVKFSFGHIIEALAIALSKASGHTVTGEQDELVVDDVVGHRDCVIDGCVVDVKSASSRSFIKFKDGSIKENDPFGYLEQLDGYLAGSLEDPLVTVKDRAYLLAIDKQLGHMCLYEHRFREEHIHKRIADYKEIISLKDPPGCTCPTEPDGQSGNIKLGLTASYSAHKYNCFPNLRTFLYEGGPRYLTKVVRQPKNQYGPITEVDRNGKVVYH